MWLVFATPEAALAAVATIDANMGLPVSADAVTRSWAVPRETSGGDWAIPKCRDEDLTGVGGFELVSDPQWPPVGGP